MMCRFGRPPLRSTLSATSGKPEELIARFEESGLEAVRLQREGRLLMRPEEDPLGGRETQLGRLIEEVGEGRMVWASFDWVRQVGLETALEQQGRLADLVGARQLVVETAALAEVVDEWTSATLRRAQSLHSGTIMAYESGLTLSRATPMPSS